MTPANETTKNSPFSTLFKGVGYTLLGVLLFVVITLSTLVILLLYSQPMREWLISDVLPSLFQDSAYVFTIEGFTSPTHDRYQFKHLSLTENQETRLLVEEGLLELNLLSLLHSKLSVNNVHASRVVLNFPVSSSEHIDEKSPEQDADFAASSFMQQIKSLPQITIESIALDNIEMQHLPNFPFLTLNGRINAFTSQEILNTQLSLSSLDVHKNTDVKQAISSLNITFDARVDWRLEGFIKANMNEAAGGQLGQFIGLAKSDAFTLQLEMTGKPEKEHLVWELNALEFPYQNHQISALGQGRYTNNQKRIDIPFLKFMIDDKEQQLSGVWQDRQIEINAALTEFPISLTHAFQDWIYGGSITGNLSAKGTINNPDIKLDLAANTQYQKQATEIELHAEGNLETLQLGRSTLKFSGAFLETEGNLNLQNQSLDLRIHELKGPLSILKHFNVDLPTGLAARLHSTQGTLSGPWTTLRYNGKTSASGQYDQLAFKLAGPFDGDFKHVTLGGAELSFIEELGALTLNGDINWDQQSLALDIETKELSTALLPFVDVNLPNDLRLRNNAQFKVEGTFDQPTFKGQIQSHGDYQDEPLKFHTQFFADLSKLILNGFKGKINDGEINTEGTIDWGKNLIDLKLDSQLLPLSLLTLADIELPTDLEALNTIHGQLTGTLSKPNFQGLINSDILFKKKPYKLEANLNASQHLVELNSLELRETLDSKTAETKTLVSLQDTLVNLDTKHIKSSLQINQLDYASFQSFITGIPKELEGTLSAQLKVNGPLNLPNIKGLIKTEGRFENQPFSIELSGWHQEQAFYLDKGLFNWNQSLLTTSGLISKEKLDMKLLVDQFDLTSLNEFGFNFNSGQLDIDLNLTGNALAPRLFGRAELKVTSEELFSNTNQVRVVSKIKTDEHLLHIDTDVTEGDYLRGSISVASAFQPLLSWLLTTETERPRLEELALDIRAKGQAKLNWLNNFIDRDTQNVSGDLVIDAHFTGNTISPKIKGLVHVKNGHYLNAITQTQLKQADIDLRFNEREILIKHARASDGQNGDLVLEGFAELGEKNQGHIDLKLLVNQASLVRREDIEGKASGGMTLKGDFKKLQLQGDLDISPFQILLDLFPSGSIPELNVIEVAEEEESKSTLIQFPETELAIKVNVDQQAFIRGRGLDAELKGQVRALGTLAKPRYQGQFNVIRGSFELFAKKFKLEEGNVLFANEAVSLFVQGRHKSKDITFIANLSGTLDDLKISLRSIPALPEDEALARLLFGKSIKTMTPVQAIQLASAIQTLRGESSRFDPLGTARDLLHVDSISVESQEANGENGIAVGVGKYITEDVYVEITRTPEPTQPWKGSVEVELSPSINLETTTGNNAGFGGVELQWKRDY